MKKILNWLFNSTFVFRVVLMATLCTIILTAGAYCQTLLPVPDGVDTVIIIPQTHHKLNKPILYDGRIKTTIILIEDANGSKMARYNIPYIYIRYSYLDNGRIDSNHVKYYYPNRKKRIRLIYWTNISKDSLDMDSKWIKLYR